MGIRIPKNYRPTKDERFMSHKMLEYFRRKLIKWRESILEESNQTLRNLANDTIREADLADRATAETDRAIELRTRDRQRKLISKIDAAINRIEDKSYGYCDESGDPISLQRLEARPIATLSLEAQERHERRERTYRDD
jgi:DnaK suppressor protein